MNSYEARVATCGPQPFLRLGRGRLAARGWAGLRRGERVRIAVRPEDVLLCAAHPGRVSARNVLPGRVRSVRLAPGCAFVHLDVGFPLVALVTRAARGELGLRPGARVWAVVKATAVVPEPLDTARGGPAAGARLHYRLSLEAPGGTITPEHFRFLDAVLHAGTLLGAARLMGVTYRTVWRWTRFLNRAWPRPLVARSRGGRGGGGAALTRDGLRLRADHRRRERSLCG